MATRAAAKTAIDNGVTAAKADMDAFFPSTANWVDGGIRFGPAKWTFVLSETSRANALTMSSSIQSLLTAGGKSFTVSLSRRSTDAKFIQIQYGANAILINFP